MIAKRVVPVLAAASSALAASSTTASTCTVSTTTINSQADATGLSSCSTVKGTVVVGTTNTGTGGTLDISGPTSIDGDLQLENNGVLIGLTSSSLQSISGAFTINNVTSLQNLQFDQLTSAGSIAWTSVPSLTTLNFEATLSSADTITISDTYLSSLDGIDVKTATTMDINNNNRMTTLTLTLENLSDNLNVAANGADLAISLPSLTWIANMTIANATTFSAPALEVVNGSLRFDSNYFTSFEAGNLTSTSSGDVSFVGNSNMANLSFPALTSVGGGILIANNTALMEITGFPVLKTVGGAVKLRGNFTDVEFPDITDVKGAFDVVSTNDISSSCTTLKKLSSSGNGDIQGVFNCYGNDASANSDTGTNTSTTGSTGSSGSGSSSSSNSSAAGMHVSYALLGAAGVAGFSTLLW